jgi:hypothetical protein
MKQKFQVGDQVVVNDEKSYRFGREFATVVAVEPDKQRIPEGERVDGLVVVLWPDLQMTSTYAPKNLTALTEWRNLQFRNGGHTVLGETCSCGQDTVVCQVCAKIVCGSMASWMTPAPGKTFNGNVCAACAKVAKSEPSPAKTDEIWFIQDANEYGNYYDSVGFRYVSKEVAVEKLESWRKAFPKRNSRLILRVDTFVAGGAK